MQLFIEGILFYHPVVWIISGSIRSEREHCCDDCVLNATENPINYAKALIHLAEQQHYTRLAPGAVGSRKNQFESRIKRILNYDTMRTNMRDKILSLALLAGSVILLLTVSGFSAGPSFIRMHKMNGELTPKSADPIEIVYPDTIPQKKQAAEPEELEELEWEDMEIEIEDAYQEALEAIEEIDWEEMKEDMEAARLEALEEINWEEMKEEIEAAHHEALEAIEEIDWEAMKEEMEETRLEAIKEIEEIDWEEIRAEMEQNFSDMKIDMEEMKLDIENSINEIDWDEIREEIREDLENSRMFLDSIKIEMDL
jgi:hypothetical protein